jgi:GNAT superfamily N-acetyltransferase
VAVHACHWPDTTELKRLYLHPARRGMGVGRRLVKAAIAQAWDCGHARIRLDAVPDMRAAQCLHAELGFREISPCRHNPAAGARYREPARRP